MPLRLLLSGSSAVVQICNALLRDVLPLGTQDPNLNYIYVKRITDAAGAQQVSTGNKFFETVLCSEPKIVGNPVVTVQFVQEPVTCVHLSSSLKEDGCRSTDAFRACSCSRRLFFSRPVLSFPLDFFFDSWDLQFYVHFTPLVPHVTERHNSF